MGRTSATLFYALNYLLKVVLILIGVRAAMLILGIPLFELPYVDPMLVYSWQSIQAAINIFVQSPYLPRF